jgi:hypothetical protein
LAIDDLGDDPRPHIGPSHGRRARLEIIAAFADAWIRAVHGADDPALNDSEMEAILERARAAGAASARYTLLRLPLG